MKPSLNANIILSYIFKFLRGALFIMPVIVPFYESRWLNMTQIFLLQSIFAAGVIFLEVPTGYIGDMFTRKQTLFIATLFKLAGRVLYFYAPSFRFLAWAELMLALGFSFSSGTDTALFYDTLTATGQEHISKKLQGRLSAAGNFGEGIAALIGWRIALQGIDWPLLLQIGSTLLMMLVTLLFVEPPREKYEIIETWPKHLRKLVHNTLFTKSTIPLLIVVSSLLSLSTMFRAWIAQPYWSHLGITIGRFGVLWWISNISVGLFSLTAHHLERHASEKQILLWLFPVCAITYALLWSLPYIRILPVMFLLYAIRWIKTVITQDMLNKLITSKERATVLSVEWLVFRTFFMICGPLAGFVIDSFGILSWILSISWFVIVTWSIAWYMMRGYETTPSDSLS